MFCNCYLIWNITEHKLNLQELRDVDEDRDPNGGKNEGDGMQIPGLYNQLLQITEINCLIHFYQFSEILSNK